ncbi:MAG: 4Fe-4S binding protein [Methanobrevibacter sp.]|nr:4Fe-4S binding protein [Methanobrevibacter sp.]
MKAEHNMNKCSQCYECVKYCSGGALSNHEGIIIYSPNNCTLCEVCMDLCDNNAIKVIE